MNFDDLLNDIDSLKGLKLSSLNKGSNIIIEKVNRERDRVELRTEDGKLKSRSFAELRSLWDRLNQTPAVHVDSALAGSGTSRNQPETIFANLPYIEHLQIDGKKHITLLDKDSHKVGTTRPMDPVAAEMLRTEHKRAALNSVTSVMVVTGDIRVATQTFEDILGSPARPLSAGVYLKEHSGGQILVVLKNLVPKQLALGTHLVLKNRKAKKGDVTFTIAERAFVLREAGDVTVLLENH